MKNILNNDYLDNTSLSKYNIHDYNIKLLFISKDGEKLQLEGYINNIMNLFSFNEYVFPIISVSMVLSRPLLIELQTGLEEGKFLFSSEKIKVGSRDDNESYRLTSSYLKNVTLYPIDFEFDLVNAQNNVEDTHNPNFTVDIDFMLSDHLMSNKVVLSKVLKSTNIFNAMMYSFNKSINKGILLQKPDNWKIYNDILLPSMNIVNTMSYLQSYYGIYNNGLKLFFGFNRYYCISNDVSNPIVAPSEYPNVHITMVDSNDTSVDTSMGSFIDDENSTYRIKVPSLGSIVMDGISNREINGEKITFLENTQTTTIKSGKHKWTNASDKNMAKDKEQVYINTAMDNPYVMNSFIRDSKRSSYKLIVPIAGVELDFITPNKKYIITYTNADYVPYNGEYQLSEVRYNFGVKNATGDGSRFSLMGVCIFEKIIE